MVYVYDYSAFTQLVYLNGVLDNIGTLRGPYQGLNGSLTIGTNAVCPAANHWDGCLDLISYFPRVKRYLFSSYAMYHYESLYL